MTMCVKPVQVHEMWWKAIDGTELTLAQTSKRYLTKFTPPNWILFSLSLFFLIFESVALFVLSVLHILLMFAGVVHCKFPVKIIQMHWNPAFYDWYAQNCGFCWITYGMILFAMQSVMRSSTMRLIYCSRITTVRRWQPMMLLRWSFNIFARGKSTNSNRFLTQPDVQWQL